MDKYNPERDIDEGFLTQVAEWIDATGEILVLLRYLRAAGRNDFALCRSRAEFEQLVVEAPLGTEIIAFRDAELPIRSEVDETFVRAIMALVPEHHEWLVVGLTRRADSPVSEWSEFSDTHASLRESLEYIFWGKDAAAGPCPNWIKDDDSTLVSRSKGGIDGPR